jgi:hypothetical protein
MIVCIFIINNVTANNIIRFESNAKIIMFKLN